MLLFSLHFPLFRVPLGFELALHPTPQRTLSVTPSPSENSECDDFKCDLDCEQGYVNDDRDCPLCACNQRKECNLTDCKKDCPNGFKVSVWCFRVFPLSQFPSSHFPSSHFRLSFFPSQLGLKVSPDLRFTNTYSL